MDLPKNYEAIQQKYCSSSRGTRMGRRVAQNVVECAQYLKPPILVVGCGDGLEVELLAKELNVPPTENFIKGIEITPERVEIAKAHNLPVVQGSAEDLPALVGETKYSIYCAHVLEHCFDRNLVIENFKKIALDRIVIIVPVEIRGRTRNRAHYNPIPNLGYLVNLFGMDWKAINISYRWHIELEGLIVLERDPMNWPRRAQDRTPELLIKGSF